jgi:hypothetical protein
VTPVPPGGANISAGATGISTTKYNVGPGPWLPAERFIITK